MDGDHLAEPEGEQIRLEITPSPKARPELVDYAQLAEISTALREYILELNAMSA